MDPAELADAFGLGRAVSLSDEPVARGKQGVVWRLDTASGSWAVKVPFDPVDESEVALSTRLQETAYAAGVPTPEVRRARDGRVFADVSGRRVRVYSWVDLLPPDPRLDPTLVGRLLGAVHALAVPADGTPDAWYTAPVGADRWDRLVADLRAAGAPFSERLAALRDELVALESWLRPPQHLQLCHRDLWADNLLPTAAGGVCVIDWENTGPADPSQELACVVFEFAREDPARVRELLAAYRSAGGTGRLATRGDFSMLVAQLGHITELGARDWLVPNRRSPERRDAEAWVGEVLDDPHTPKVLDRILAAARSVTG
ncbi:aminoglycoside phosphotransferase family protein [Nocardioides sp. HDW12B]|uniref:phosphotransferase enzyme family protein n=1 Tax=Nocardioides sp. HDW12B TaxID=2714939 RepID=UPI0014083BF9|nr:aminoglycoside phosphotransferase family protein [Nocardioides sp. HDW12B]QIK66259.1 aminoglycoside phosphotransferase family protein [Nocardioides sp. HDW12B]